MSIQTTMPDNVTMRYHMDPSEWSGERYIFEVALPSGRTANVEVYGPEDAYGGARYAAQVNWSALGGCDPDDATTYAQAMLYAAQIAKQARGPVQVQS